MANEHQPGHNDLRGALRFLTELIAWGGHPLGALATLASPGCRSCDPADRATRSLQHPR